MSQVIYRKYRPQKFGDLIGQEHIKTTIENEIKTDKVSHAYLFSGPRGIGKTTTARLIAKAVNCQNRKEGESEPCNKCAHCQAVITGNFLDLIEIDAASNRGIDEIRELRERVRFSPSNGKFKVFIIDEVHMLTTEAFNALLKTLEEPPSHAIFILATTELHKIPETIISRCQRFDFKRVTIKDLVSRLEKIAKSEEVKIDKEVLGIIASRSEGCIRDAESLLQQIFSLGEKNITMEQAGLVLPRSDQKLVIKFCEYLFQNDIKNSLGLINDFVSDGIDLERFAIDAIEFLRQILVHKTNPNLIIDTTAEVQDKLKNLSAKIENLSLIRLIKLFLEKRKDLKQAEIPQLPLELLLVLEFCESTSIIEQQPLNNNDKSASVNKENIIANPTPKNPNPQTNTASSPNKSINAINATRLQARQVNTDVTTPVNLNKLKSSWPTILNEIKKYNHSISAFLKVSEIICVKENIIEIGFPYKFHQNIIKNPKNKKIIEDCISKIIKQDAKIEVKYIEPAKVAAQPKESTEKPNQNSDLMNDMLNEFGGEVVG